MREACAYVGAGLLFIYAAVCAAACDEREGRTSTMEDPNLVQDTQQRTRADLERCRQHMPLERLKCMTHSY